MFLGVFGSMQLVDVSLWLLSKDEFTICSSRNHAITRVAMYIIMSGTADMLNDLNYNLV